MGDRRPSWSRPTSRPAPQYTPQPHEAAWYRAFFVTAPPRNIAATNLQLPLPRKFVDSPNVNSSLLFSNPCLINHIAFSACAVVCGISLALAKESSEETSPSAQNFGHQRLRGLDPFPIGG